MGIPGSPYSRDFGDPVVIIGIPFSRRLAVRYGSTLTVRVQFSRRVKRKMSKYKVAKSGGESISLYEIENGRSRSQEPQPEKAPTNDSRLTLSTTILQ